MTYTFNHQRMEYDPQKECKVLIEYHAHTYTAECSECARKITPVNNPNRCPGCDRNIVGTEER